MAQVVFEFLFGVIWVLYGFAQLVAFSMGWAIAGFVVGLAFMFHAAWRVATAK